MIPYVLELIIISSTKLDQKIGLNLILIKPGLTTVTLSISGSLFLIIGDICSARSIGDLLFFLESTIATLVDMSQSNLGGGISALIPLNVSGTDSLPSLLSSVIIIFIFSKYNSKIFI